MGSSPAPGNTHVVRSEAIADQPHPAPAPELHSKTIDLEELSTQMVTIPREGRKSLDVSRHKIKLARPVGGGGVERPEGKLAIGQGGAMQIYDLE